MPSIIWQIGLYRKVEGTEGVECKLCLENGKKKTTLSTKNSATSNLIAHLKSSHKETEFFEKYCSLDNLNKKDQTGPMDKHLRINASGGNSSMDKKVINWIASTQQSFLLHDESYYRKRALPSAYLLVKNKIKKEFEDCPKLSFTTDIWSNGIVFYV
uniref:BED-type domain-containing protein n=1 Tax=Meloidogyne javanica TaxID=6303 RepID=A0A915MF82_MELJA